MNSLVARIQNLERSVALIHQRLDEIQAPAQTFSSPISKRGRSKSSDLEDTNATDEEPREKTSAKTSKRWRSESTDSTFSDSEEKATVAAFTADYSHERFFHGILGGEDRLKDIKAMFTQVLPPDEIGSPNGDLFVPKNSKRECIIRPNSWVSQSYYMYKFRQVFPDKKLITRMNSWFNHCRKKWKGNEITQQDTTRPGIYVWQRGERDTLIRYNP